MQANEQKTTRDYNSSYPKRRFRPRAISYVKRFETFKEGFSEIIKFNPELKNYCGRDPIAVNVIAAMLNSVKDNIPTTDNPNYPNTLSLSIDAKEIGFKTDINIAIGWRTEYFFREGKTYYNFRISFFTIPTYKKSIIEEMVQSGWKKIERGNGYHSHFWDKTSDKPNMKKNRRFHSDSQKISTIPKNRQESVDLLPESDEDIENIPESHIHAETTTPTPDPDNKVEIVPTDKVEDIENIPESHIHEETTTPTSEPDNKVEIVPTDEVEDIGNVPFPSKKHLLQHLKLREEEENSIRNAVAADNAQTFKDPKDSVVKSPVNGTYIVTHNNKTNVINMNDPENENNLGIIIDRENKTATYPDGTVFNLNF